MVERGSHRGRLAAVLFGTGMTLLAACAAPTPASSATGTSTSEAISVVSTSPATSSASQSPAESAAPVLTLPPELTSTISTSANGSAGGTTAPALPDCTHGGLPTVTAGVLTIATGSPAQSPWFVGDSPTSGEGLEPAVAYAVAGALGYARDEVTWTSVDRAQAAAGAAGGFDLDLNQFTAPDSGTPSADYSTGYFSLTDAVVMRRESPAQPGSVAALQGLSLGAQAGSASADTVRRVTGSSAQTFPGAAEALSALVAGSVQGVVLPIQAAVAVTAANPGLTLVGQLPSDPEMQPEQFKVLLPAESALTGCVSTAIDKLRVEGTLRALADQWVLPVVPKLN